jgi:large subunit ribosomal protein L22
MGKESRKSNHANRAIARGVRIAPRKARIVADLVRNKPVDEALNILMFTPKKAAPLISGLIENALHSVELSEELDWDIDDLVVSRIVVDEGPTLRRFRPRAMGRATRINKRTSHITVELSVLN